MSNKDCTTCYYSESCRCDDICEDYTPVNDQAIGEDIDDIIEMNRIAFRAEWFKYIDSLNS